MIALITGINGFVGAYLKTELESHGYDVYGLDFTTSPNEKIIKCDITNPDSVNDAIQKIRPDMVFHLAGFSSLTESFDKPELCFQINVDGTKNILHALKNSGLAHTKILIISSSLVYGIPAYVPIDEHCPLNPDSPYAFSRIEQENIALKSGLPVIISRSFNHTGPTQRDNFAIPSFKKQVREASDGDSIYVGNLDVIRDFSDVRDVVKAYRLLLEKGKSGEIYNVGSGIGRSLRYILDQIILGSRKNLKVAVDPAKIREHDIPEIVCNPEKLFKVIGFRFKEIDYSL